MASVKATVTAPCGSCAHEPICNRIGSLERLAGQINVESTPLHAGLTVAISATIDCDAYLRARGSNTHARAALAAGEPAGAAEARKTGVHVWTDEQRAAAAERMRQRNAAAGGNVAVAARALADDPNPQNAE